MNAYKIMARNTRTGVRLQKQYLDGTLIRDHETAMAVATQFAQTIADRSREPWVGEVAVYQTKN
jgi:phage terminase large subunit-like protein